MDITSLIAIIVSLLLIGFFAGVETSFLSANKLSIELNKKQGTYSGKFWGTIATEPTRFISAMLLVFNIVLVIYGILIGELLYPIWHWMSSKLTNMSEDNLSYIKLFTEIIIASFLLLITEFFFRAMFRSRTSSILSNGLITFLVRIVYSLFAGIATYFVRLAEWILKYVINIKISDRKEMFSKIDLEHFVQQSKNNTYEDEGQDKNQELFENALSIGETKLRECLVPRKEIVRIERTATMDELKKAFVETRLSKLVVYENNIDTIVGYIHQLDLFSHPATLEEIMHPIPAVPDSMSATDLMNKLSLERKSIAWVIDEFGGTAGIITMEDLLEEIFGEIKDEYDDLEEFIDKQIAEAEFIFSGRLELDYLTDKYDLEFLESEAETLSGYIIEQHEDIPGPNERIIIGRQEFNIIGVDGTRIETVKMKLL